MPNQNNLDMAGHTYGFNGMENDNEISGAGNSLDFGARMYNSRLGRWFAKDPLEAKYTSLSPYNFVANMPIVAIDPDGRDIVIVGSASYRAKVLKSFQQLARSEEGRRMIREIANSSHKVIIHNNPDENKNRYLGSKTKDGVTQHVITFEPKEYAPYPVGEADPNKEIERPSA